MDLTIFGGAAVTLHDSNANQFDAIYVGVTGTLKITTKSGDVLTLKGLIAGTIYKIDTAVIWSTGSTATDIVGLRLGAR